MVTELDVVRFFVDTWPTFCPDTVTVELQQRAKSCPSIARVGWDTVVGTWRILAPMGKEPYKLLDLLYHEAAHVRFQTLVKGVVDWPMYRRVFRGEHEPAGLATVTAQTTASVTVAPLLETEQRCDRWAAVMTARWWPTLRDWQDGQQAARVAWWVHNQKLEATE